MSIRVLGWQNEKIVLGIQTFFLFHITYSLDLSQHTSAQEYIESRLVLKNTDKPKIFIAGASTTKLNLNNITKVRVNAVKGLCFKALIRKHMIKHYLEKYGKL